MSKGHSRFQLRKKNSVFNSFPIVPAALQYPAEKPFKIFFISLNSESGNILPIFLHLDEAKCGGLGFD